MFDIRSSVQCISITIECFWSDSNGRKFTYVKYIEYAVEEEKKNVMIAEMFDRKSINYRFDSLQTKAQRLL